MATFAKLTFNAASYASYRPTYPKSLFDFIYAYHAQSGRARWDKVVDLGCGTGQATITVAERFEHAIGCDPSPGMIENARLAVEQLKVKNKPSFVLSPAEELKFLEDKSVDMIISAQAAHWFNYSKLFPELARVLRPGGTVAIWNYNEVRFGYRELDEMVSEYSHGENSLGPHWEQPGRSILEDYLRRVPVPTTPPWDASSVRRAYFVGNHEPGMQGETHPAILSKYLDWDGFDKYLRTWSSLHTYMARHPDDKDAQGRDIVQRFVKDVRDKGEKVVTDLDGWKRGFVVEWPLAMILLRKGD